MRNNHMKRFLSMALLLAFMAPSGIAPMMCSAESMSDMTLAGDVRLTDRNESITLSLRDSDVRQVLRMFADKAGMNIVFHDSVKGKVTLDLVDMPINDAFSLVLQVTGLNYYTQGKTLIVLSKNHADNAAFSKQEMMTFPVRYVDAGKIAAFLNKNVFGMKKAGLSGVDAATVNAATNEIIVFGMRSDAAIVEKVIAQLDREPMSRTFAVNHTTPAEMANMICQVLLPSRGSGSTSNSSSKGEYVPPTPGVGTSLGGAAGIMTGGASSSSSKSEELKLGEGIVACSVAASAVSSAAAAFDVQNLSVAYFPQRGTITLMGGSVAQQEMVEKFIRDNDVKQAQAYLEVSIVELDEDAIKDIGNEWSIDSKHWAFTFTGDSTGGYSNKVGNTSDKYVAKPILVVDGDQTSVGTSYVPRNNSTYIKWTMDYLIKNKKGRVLANPRLLITSGQESVLDLTQDYVEKVTSEFLSSSASSAGQNNGTVQKTYTIGEDLGIKVTLTPFISPEGYVTMNVKPEYSTKLEELRNQTTKDVEAVLLSRRNLDLKNVRIKDGETLAIGGLIQESEEKTVYKIPVLGDLPIIGSAFRSTSTSKVKKELVIMLTPRIINDGEGSVADSL